MPEMILKRRTRVYVAGPYTKGDVAVNVRTAMLAASDLMDHGYAPYVPHFTHFQHMLFPRPYGDWIRQDNQFLSCCDAVLRLPGDSSGADGEVKVAETLGIPTFKSIEDLNRRPFERRDGIVEETSTMSSPIDYSDEDTRTPSAEEARTARRATLTEHGRLVEDLADDFNEAVRSNDLQGFFERIAVRLIGPRP